MKKKEQGKGAILGVSLFISAVLLTALTFHSCQKDELSDLNAMYEQEGDEGTIVFSTNPSTAVFPEVFVGPATFYSAKGKDGNYVTIWIEGTDLGVAKSTREYGNYQTCKILRDGCRS